MGEGGEIDHGREDYMSYQALVQVTFKLDVGEVMVSSDKLNTCSYYNWLEIS